MPTNLDWNLKFLACRMKDWTARNRLTCRKFSHRPPMPMRFYPERTVSVTHSQDINQLSSQFLGKLFASSSFYSPTIHPTVEDQVDLARRISHSLSDISNQTSKGQTMYSNRKKRSVKWIHDDGHEEERFIEGIFNLKAVRWVIPSIKYISFRGSRDEGKRVRVVNSSTAASDAAVATERFKWTQESAVEVGDGSPSRARFELDEQAVRLWAISNVTRVRLWAGQRSQFTNWQGWETFYLIINL